MVALVINVEILVWLFAELAEFWYYPGHICFEISWVILMNEESTSDRSMFALLGTLGKERFG